VRRPCRTDHPLFRPRALQLDEYPEHELPKALTGFAAERSGLDYLPEENEIFLYHGTNCYRRWEIKRTGAIEPGRSHYSFFCTRAGDAFRYARAACLRDVAPGAANSLTCEPVVLRVRFNSRTWLQVDFIQNVLNDEGGQHLTLAVLGPVSSSAVVDVLHCRHGRRLGSNADAVRSFEDGSLLIGIQQLRASLMRKRMDTWVMQRLGGLSRSMQVTLEGGEMPDLTFEDNLRRLRQVRV
jgi:hypothetical protein